MKHWLLIAASLVFGGIIGAVHDRLSHAQMLWTQPMAKGAAAGGGVAGCNANGWTLVANTIVASPSGGGATGNSPAINTTGANLIVAVVSWYAGAANTTAVVGSTPANTFVQAVLQANGTTTASKIMYVYAPTTSATQTFNVTSSGTPYVSLAVAAFSGAVATPLDQTNSAVQSGAVTTIQAGTGITPTASNELIIAGLEVSSGITATPTIGGGFTVTNANVSVSGQYETVGLACATMATAGLVNPPWNWTGAIDAIATIASFR